jgi:Zn-dependent metalloprotease
LVAVIIAVAAPAVAQQGNDAAKQAIEQAKRANPNLSVTVDGQTGRPISLRGLRIPPPPSLGGVQITAGSNQRPPTDDEARTAALAAFTSSSIAAAFPTKNAQNKYESTAVRSDPDIPGQKIVQVEQSVGGVKVFGAAAKVVVSPNLTVTQMTVTLSDVDIASTNPTTTADQAVTSARARLRELETVRTRDATFHPFRINVDAPAKTELVVYDPQVLKARGAQAGPTRLAWLVSIDTMRLFVDAQTNSVLYFFRDNPSAALRRVFDLAGAEAFPGKKVVDDADNTRVDPLPADAEKAYSYSGVVQEFFAKVLKRPGLTRDEADKVPFVSYVRFGQMKNAFWCQDAGYDCPAARVMVYGPGYASALDIVGHEIMHGIIAEEAALIYADEPGAVNEGLADIFGTLIELYAKGGAGNWVIGEGLPGRSVDNPMRSLVDPNLSDINGKPLFNPRRDYAADNRGQPARYAEYLRREDPLCNSTSDMYNGCVHFNSGILNRFAYLISEGGRIEGQVVKGIGQVKLARIAYRALIVHMSKTSTLAHAAEGFWKACADFVDAGAADFVAMDCDQVKSAQAVVGLSAPPS